MKKCFTSNDWKEIGDRFVRYEELCEPNEVIQIAFEERAVYKGVNELKRSFDKTMQLPEDLAKVRLVKKDIETWAFLFSKYFSTTFVNLEDFHNPRCIPWFDGCVETLNVYVARGASAFI